MASQPIVIAVMGPSGSGKTNFINQLTGTREDKEAHQLKSHTRDIREFTFNQSEDRQYMFVDFPAFDDSYRSNRDILWTIAKWLEKRYRRKVNLNGIIYTHRITNDRMSGSVWKNLDMFGRLCGDRAAGGVRLVTTVWDKVNDREIAEGRVSQLEADLWKPLIDAGARHKRFENNSPTCAWEIVEDLTGGGKALLIQEELVDAERKLNETTAGRGLYEQLQKLLKEQKETIEWLQEEGKAQKDPRLVREFEGERRRLKEEQRRLKAELKRTWDDTEKLKIHFSKRIAPFFFKKTSTRPVSAKTLRIAEKHELPAVAENDYVIFVVGPTAAEKAWFTLQLCRDHIGVGHPRTTNVKAWRCNLSDGSDNVIIVNTPSFRSNSRNFDFDYRMTEWLELKFNPKCHSGILFLHSLDSDPIGGGRMMSWHLEVFAKAFGGRFTMPSDIYVVPTSNPVATLPSDTLSQRLSQLKTMTEGLNGRGERGWRASLFPGVFKGQTETAWSAALLLFKSIPQAQTTEFFASPDARVAMKNLAGFLFKEFKVKTWDRDLDSIIMLGRTALEFTPLECSEYRSALIDLAGLLSQRFSKEGRKDDLDDLITLKHAVLECMSSDEPQRQISLLELEVYLSERLRRTFSMVDLEETISLRRAALERIPLPNQCKALLKLADALHEQFQKQGMENSIAEALSLARAALPLCPPGHPDHALPRRHLASYLETTRLALFDHANPIFNKFKKKEKDRDLDATIMLGQTALEFMPPDHSLRHSTLIHLTGLLLERFNKDGRKEDLDKLITLKRAVLENMPADEPQRHSHLLELDSHLFERFKRTNSTVDLEEVISCHRAVLEHIPPPNRCRALLDLADALHEQYQRQGTEHSIVDAISLAQAALRLCPAAHPDHMLPRDRLTSYLQTKVRKTVHMGGMGAGPSSTSSYDIRRLIGKAVSDKVEKIPLRLLFTPTGDLCNRDAQISRFEGSSQYEQLLSLASSLDKDQLETEINNVISEYFGFTTLSHRWGSGEPLLRDVEGRRVYDLGSTDGETKLQIFCNLSFQRNFLWAWSDTCCIDKDSSAELQEAIGSMFSWYRWSSLTIVHLPDVVDAGSLADSVWFTRGWTLQELLASRTILFYTYDWLLYSTSDVADHKTDPALLRELQNATGIEKRHLTDFCPGVDDARSRLHWASRRRTTRPEDIAYSLFGIFQVHLPVFYGESAQNALGRLLAEIISRSGDVSVLDWAGKPSLSPFNSCFPPDLTPYQMVPHFPLILSDPAKRNSLNLEKAQKLYRSLKRLPRAGFVNNKLTLPSTAHAITAAKLRDSLTSPSRYTYEIQASRLQTLNVTLSVELDEIVDTCIVVRPWHPKTLEKPTDRDIDAVWKLLEQLEQPFNALLLKRLPHNEYTRIACDCRITAYIQDLDSILDSEVLILEIV